MQFYRYEEPSTTQCVSRVRFLFDAVERAGLAHHERAGVLHDLIHNDHSHLLALGEICDVHLVEQLPETVGIGALERLVASGLDADDEHVHLEPHPVERVGRVRSDRIDRRIVVAEHRGERVIALALMGGVEQFVAVSDTFEAEIRCEFVTSRHD